MNTTPEQEQSMQEVANITQQDDKASELRKTSSELFTALAKAQGEFKPIEKNREVVIQTKSGGSYKFRYADLEEILSKTRPALAANGLSIIQVLDHTQAGALLTCRLLHSGGYSISSEIKLPLSGDSDPKAFGALISYYRRYLVTAMLGVAADDDLDQDGQGAEPTGKQPQNKPARRNPPPPPPQDQQAAPAQPAAAEVLTAEEIANIETLASEVGKPISDICAAYKVGSLNFIKRSSYQSIVKRLEEARAQ